MTPTPQHQRLIKGLCEHARHFYTRGWMPGTSGNLSVKLSQRPLTIAITPTGVDKGALTPKDILTIGANGRILKGRRGLRPSMETTIHQAIYEEFPACGAVFHVHTIHATLIATHFLKAGFVTISGLEMLKGFQTFAPGAAPQIPVFPNMDNLDEFAQNVRRHAARLRKVPGFLIAHHGMTAWGRDVQDAEKHLELLEFLCRYLWEIKRWDSPVPALLL